VTVTNTAPDQTVVLTAGTGISTSGTYPNFTITNTSPSSGGTVTSVGGTGTVNGISLSGTVTSSGNLTLGGTLSGVSLTTQVTGTLPIANGGTGETTRQAAMDALAGAVTSGQYLRGNGTDVIMSAIQAADVPTLNQNTTGTASNVTGTVAIANGGTGATTASTARSGLLPSYTSNGGRVLAVNSGATDVEWIAPPTGLTLLSTTTIPAGSPTNVDITGLTSTYASLVIVVRGLVPSASAQLRVSLSGNNGSTYSGAQQLSTAGSTSHTGVAQIYNTNATGSASRTWIATINSAAASGGVTVTDAINALRFNFNNSATFTQAGSILIYGE